MKNNEKELRVKLLVALIATSLFGCGGSDDPSINPNEQPGFFDDTNNSGSTNTGSTNTGSTNTGSTNTTTIPDINSITIVNNTDNALHGLRASWNLGAGHDNPSYTDDKYGGWKNVTDEYILPRDVENYDIEQPVATGGFTGASLIVLRTEVSSNGGKIFTELGRPFNIDQYTSTSDTWNIVQDDLIDITINNNQSYSIVEMSIKQVFDSHQIVNNENIFPQKENVIEYSVTNGESFTFNGLAGGYFGKYTIEILMIDNRLFRFEIDRNSGNEIINID